MGFLLGHILRPPYDGYGANTTHLLRHTGEVLGLRGGGGRQHRRSLKISARGFAFAALQWRSAREAAGSNRVPATTSVITRSPSRSSHRGGVCVCIGSAPTDFTQYQVFSEINRLTVLAPANDLSLRR